MNKNKKLIIAISLLVVLAIAGTAYYFLSDRQTYIAQDKNIKEYIQSLQASYPVEGVQSEKYCSYAHQKFSKGSLGCGVNYTFYNAHKDVITADFDNKAANFGWIYSFDNTAGNNKYSEQQYILSRVYKYKNITCGLHITKEDQRYKYQIGCSGPAKAEWFPVKTN